MTWPLSVFATPENTGRPSRLPTTDTTCMTTKNFLDIQNRWVLLGVFGPMQNLVPKHSILTDGMGETTSLIHILSSFPLYYQISGQSHT